MKRLLLSSLGGLSIPSLVSAYRTKQQSAAPELQAISLLLPSKAFFFRPSSPQRPHTLPSRMQIPPGTPLLYCLSNCSDNHLRGAPSSPTAFSGEFAVSPALTPMGYLPAGSHSQLASPPSMRT